MKRFQSIIALQRKRNVIDFNFYFNTFECSYTHEINDNYERDTK